MRFDKKNNGSLIQTLSDGNKLVDVRIIVPKRFNNGRPIPVIVIREIERNIRYSAGGYTKYSNSGVWEDGVKVFTDNNFEYKIITSDDGIADLKNIAEDVKKVCGQEAVFFSVSPTKVSFI